MELSGVELRYLVNEIGSSITSGYYISAINAVTRDSLLLRLHHPTKEDVILILSARGIWITKLKFKPVEDNSIERAAIAELERARVESIEQAGSERIAIMKLRRLDGQVRNVVVEFFGEGNIVICDGEMQILSILKPIEVRHRTLNVGFRYAFPPQRGVDVFSLSLEQMLVLRNEAKNLDVLRWIGRGLSMPKKFVEEVANKAGIEPSMQASQLSDQDVHKIFSTIKSLVGDIASGKNHEPVIVLQDDGKPVDALPVVTEQAKKMGTIRKVPTYMEALDEVLSNEILDIGKSSRTVEIDRQIALLEHDIEEQNKAKEAVLQKAAAIRKLAGDLMAVSYSGPSDDVIKGVLDANSSSFVMEKGVRYVHVTGEKIEVQQNLAKLSSMLFARAKEMERGNASIEEARAKLVGQIEKLRNKTEAIHKKLVVQKQTAKEWYERYRWFVTSDGLLAIGGRDASSNSALVRKHLTEDDIVFHAEVHGSPFFIVKNAATAAREEEGSRIDSSLVQVAQATVSFSRAWKDGLSSADAYWVFPEQIKKGAPTGQFLPKGSFVIEGKRSYIKGVEVRLALGIMLVNGRLSLVCGPEAAIKKRSIVYAVLLQGGLDPMNAAKKAKSALISAAAASSASAAATTTSSSGHNNNDSHHPASTDGVAGEEKGEDDNDILAETIKNMSLDDFVRALPTGQSKIAFAAKGEAGSNNNNNNNKSN